MPASPFPLSMSHKTDMALSFLYTKLFEVAFSSRDSHVHHSCRFYGYQNLSIGNRFRARRGLWLEAVSLYFGQSFNPKLLISDDFSVSENTHIACCSMLTIGRSVLVGSCVLITDHNHGDYSSLSSNASSPLEPPMYRALSCNPVVIGDNVFIGDGARILPGSTIDNGAIIAANSVVMGHVPRNTIVAGSPARPVKVYDSKTLTWLRVVS